MLVKLCNSVLNFLLVRYKNIHLDAPYRFGSTVAGVDTFQSDVDMLYCIHCKYHIYFFNILLCGYITCTNAGFVKNLIVIFSTYIFNIHFS